MSFNMTLNDDYSYNLSVNNYTGVDLVLETQMQKYTVAPTYPGDTKFSVMISMTDPVGGVVPDRVVLHAGQNSAVIYLSKLKNSGTHSADGVTVDGIYVSISVGYTDLKGNKYLVDPDQNLIEKTDTNTNYIYLSNYRDQQKLDIVTKILSTIKSYYSPNNYLLYALIAIILVVVAVAVTYNFTKKY